MCEKELALENFNNRGDDNIFNINSIITLTTGIELGDTPMHSVCV